VSSRFEQGIPLCIVCWITSRILVLVPLVFEQLLHSLHPPSTQSTGVTALQLTLQPGLVPPPSVTNTKLTLLLQLQTLGGRVELVFSPPITRLPAEPQLFSIKVAPLPSMIVRWSKPQSEWGSMSNAVNSSNKIIPCSTSSLSVSSRESG